MFVVSQAQSFGDIRIDGQGNSLSINQVVQLTVTEVKTRSLIPNSPYLDLSRLEERPQDFFYRRDASGATHPEGGRAKLGTRSGRFRQWDVFGGAGSAYICGTAEVSSEFARQFFFWREYRRRGWFT